MHENTKPNSPILRFEKLYKITNPLCCDEVFIKENETHINKNETHINKNETHINENETHINENHPKTQMMNRDNDLTSIDIYESLTPLTPLISVKTKSCCPSFGILSRWSGNH